MSYNIRAQYSWRTEAVLRLYTSSHDLFLPAFFILKTSRRKLRNIQASRYQWNLVVAKFLILSHAQFYSRQKLTRWTAVIPRQTWNPIWKFSAKKSLNGHTFFTSSMSLVSSVSSSHIQTDLMFRQFHLKKSLKKYCHSFFQVLPVCRWFKFGT